MVSLDIGRPSLIIKVKKRDVVKAAQRTKTEGGVYFEGKPLSKHHRDRYAKRKKNSRRRKRGSRHQKQNLPHTG